MRLIFAMTTLVASMLTPHGSLAILLPNAQDPIVGVWQGTKAASVGGRPEFASERIQDLGRFPTLNIKADHTFELQLGSTATGTWARSGKVCHLFLKGIRNSETAHGHAKTPPMNVTLSANKTILTLKGDSKNPFWIGDLTMTFTRGIVRDAG